MNCLHINNSRFRWILLVVLIATIPSAAKAPVDRALPENYVSDNCSWFPDGNYGDGWVAKVKIYFFGGTKQERRAADDQLFRCVKGKGRGFIAKMMWRGVRVGGAGFWKMPFSWGFGKDWAKKHPPGSKK